MPAICTFPWPRSMESLHSTPSSRVLEELKKELKIDVGGVTPDGKFSLECLRCVGACGLAPVMLVDEKVYGRLEPKQIKSILAQYE